MADILDILIEILRIDCSVVQCYYANPIEGLFYMFFFPTVFIILFIYILTSFIFRGGGKVRGLKLLIALGAYAFIIFESLYTFFAAISHLWWLLTILLVGLFAFVRYLFTGGHEGGRGGMPGVGGGSLRGVIKEMTDAAIKKKFKKPVMKALGISDKENDTYDEIWDKYKRNGMNALSPAEQGIIKLSLAVEAGVADATQISELKNLIKSESKD